MNKLDYSKSMGGWIADKPKTKDLYNYWINNVYGL